MAQTFFFYDLETSGLNSRSDRIMQFAGIRTDMDFNQIGEPYNLLVALSDDTLPNPGALMVTGISPQKTVEEGYTEAEFAKLLSEEIFTPDTIVLGFNSIRFDDEFIRALFWRNYFDPYEWCYKNGQSRWDMLDAIRMTRALRPEGIKWPMVDGVPVNKLELITYENGLDHLNAHDALSDVQALIDATKLVQSKQPQLFKYLLDMRDKNKVKELVNLDNRQPFVYSSGRYDSQFNKTTVAVALAEADFGNVFVYDLRYDPTDWVNKSEKELNDILYTPYKERGDDYVKLPVKKLQYNRAPAVAPMGVLGQADGWKKLSLELGIIEKHRSILLQHPEFAARVAKILLKKPEYPSSPEAETKLYDGFISSKDKLRSEAVRNLSSQEIGSFKPQFDDKRLQDMFVRYKARNFPRLLTSDERVEYEEWRAEYLKRQIPGFFKELEAQAKRELDDHQQYIIEELKLWLESIMPESE